MKSKVIVKVKFPTFCSVLFVYLCKGMALSCRITAAGIINTQKSMTVEYKYKSADQKKIGTISDATELVDRLSKPI